MIVKDGKVISSFGITVELKYPAGPRPAKLRPTSTELVAYMSYKICDGTGFEVYIKSCQLMRNPEGVYFIQLPHEPKKAPCPSCHKPNADHAPFCNWCAVELPCHDKGWFMDCVVPANAETRAALLAVAVAEHEKRTAEAPEPVGE